MRSMVISEYWPRLCEFVRTSDMAFVLFTSSAVTCFVPAFCSPSLSMRSRSSPMSLFSGSVTSATDILASAGMFSVFASRVADILSRSRTSSSCFFCRRRYAKNSIVAIAAVTPNAASNAIVVV